MNITHKDALGILELNASASADDIKTAYRVACSKYHPDRNPAGLEMMKLVNLAYEALRDYVAQPDINDGESSLNLGDELNAALNAVIGLGLTIEICGSWIWISGDTRPHKEILKEAGYKWAPIKKMWHFRPSDYKSFSRGKYSMDEIRERHGSVNVKQKHHARLSA